MHEFDKYWTTQKNVFGKLVMYADDFVILFVNKESAELGLKLVKNKLTELGLTLNSEKTKIVDISGGKQGFDFLGFHHRQSMSREFKRRYTLKYPKKESVKKLMRTIGNHFSKRSTLKLSLETIIWGINPVLRGWMNYYRFGNSSKVFNKIDWYVKLCLSKWIVKKKSLRGNKWKSGIIYKQCLDSNIFQLSGKVRYWSNDLNMQ